MDPQPTTPGHDKILVVGAGATGGFFGAMLARRGRDVTFLVRPPRAAALRQQGLRVTGQGHDDVIDAKVVTTQDLADPFDLVLLSVKATGLAVALDDLAPAVGPDTAVVPFLNGLDHMRVLNERFGPQRVLGGVVVVATALDADGTIVQLAPGASLTIGEQDGAPAAGLWPKLLSATTFDRFRKIKFKVNIPNGYGACPQNRLLQTLGGTRIPPGATLSRTTRCSMSRRLGNP